MVSSKAVCRANGRCGCRKPSHAIGVWLLLGSMAGLLLLGSTYTDVSFFYFKSYNHKVQEALQIGAITEDILQQQQSQGSSPAPTDSFEDIAQSQYSTNYSENFPAPTDSFSEDIAQSQSQSSNFSGDFSAPTDSFSEDVAQSQSQYSSNSSENFSVAAPEDGSGLNDSETVSESPGEVEFQPSEGLVMPGVDEAQNSTKTSTKQTKKKTTTKRCDISRGRWVYDETYPLYRSRNCPFADPGFRCEENGRPDLEFMKWRWQPHDCDLPRFDPKDMLERLRNQRMVFVGDSLGRNHWESMLCMLAEGVQNKSRIYETNGETISKHVGSLVFRFEDYNCSVEYYRDPFLVPQTRPPPNSLENVTNVLKIDRVSWSVSKWWPGANILVLNSGHWWSSEKIFRGGGQFQMGDNLTNHTYQEGFQEAMKTWALWMEENLDPETIQVFFRSYASVHFRGGSWNTGGRCDQEVLPLTDEEVEEMQVPPWTNPLIVDAINKYVKSKRGAVEFLDVTPSTDYRADGHGGLYTRDVAVYGVTRRSQQDCSHFCLPGVPDTWNEFLYATLLARGQGSWGERVQ